MDSATVCIKIPKQLKEKIRRLKIKPSIIMRQALEEEVRKREIGELRKEIVKLKPTLEKVTMDNAVKNIREDRDGR